MISQFAITLALAAAKPAGAPVPIGMQGSWGKHGRCDVLADRLTITRHTAGWGKGPFDRIYYDPQSEVPTIYWDEEGVVDNFVMGRTRNLLVHNTQGFHMPGEEGYARCGPNHKRVSWPPPLAAPMPLDRETVTLFGADRVNTHTVEAVWNGIDTVFVDYPSKDAAGYIELQLYAVQRPNGHLTQFKVTEGEPEGGDAGIAAIGFANADRDSRQELIVILEWPQSHLDVQGRLLEVRLFDDPRPGQTALTPLRKLSQHFGVGCECDDRDGTKRDFRFKTVASVKKELRRLGY